jgi:hypothetical protein
MAIEKWGNGATREETARERWPWTKMRSTKTAGYEEAEEIIGKRFAETADHSGEGIAGEADLGGA